MKLLKVQKALFIDESKELTKAEYDRLVQEAQRKNNERLALVIQTICATGIRVSELRFITVESVQNGRVEISSKGKRRMVFLPDKLRQLLRNYVRKQKKTAGGGIHHPHLYGRERGYSRTPNGAIGTCDNIVCVLWYTISYCEIYRSSKHRRSAIPHKLT